MPARKNATLFGKPYTWTLDEDGRISLHPTLKHDQPQHPDVPFSAELVRAAMHPLRTR